MIDLKRQAAEAALEFLPEHGVIGLGTGSTANHFIEAVARLVAGGRRLRCVATSERSRQKAEALGVTVLPDAGPWDIDVCVDGADEVSDALDLIKGGGACHTREKIVNRAARQNVIVVDESKLSRRLGEKWPVPVEVLQFGLHGAEAGLRRFGEVALRQVESGRPVLTDSGHYIFDVHAGVIPDPVQLERELHAIPGVIETGLFIQRADVLVVASAQGVRVVRRAG